MKRRPIRALALMLAALLACTGCGGANYETGAPDYTVGVVLKTQESEHWLRDGTRSRRGKCPPAARLADR